MNIEKFIKEMNSKIKESWKTSSQEQEEFDYCNEQDSFIASVQTRQDVALNLSINALKAKILSSIKTGVWFLVIIELIRLVIDFFS